MKGLSKSRHTALCQCLWFLQLCRGGPKQIVASALAKSLVYLFDRPILPYYNKGKKLSCYIII